MIKNTKINSVVFTIACICAAMSIGIAIKLSQL